MGAFAEGFAFIEKNTGNYVAAELGNTYVSKVEDAIQILKDRLDQEIIPKATDPKQLKGNLAEIWHAETYNINSAVKGKNLFNTKAITPNSHELLSPDIIRDKSAQYSLKYYSSPENTMREQIVYAGQYRLVPSDQIDEIKKALNEKLTSGKLNSDQAKRYKETLDMLTDRVSNGKGVESIPLDLYTAQELTERLKELGYSDEAIEAMGISVKNLIENSDIMRQALNAGLTAAAITAIIKASPEIYKAIASLIKNGELDFDQFRKIGFSALSGAGEGFISGAICHIITTHIKIALSEAVKSLSKAALNSINSALPAFVAAVVSITTTTMKYSYLVAKGDMTRTVLANDIVRDIFVSACSIGHGLALEAAVFAITKVSTIGFMLGSFIGSMLGSFVYDVGNKLAISFCVETGFTMFGLVEQNYELPDEVFESIGAEVFKYEEFAFEEFAPEEFTFEEFSTEPFMPEEISISVLRRGVIGVHKIGYLN